MILNWGIVTIPSECEVLHKEIRGLYDEVCLREKLDAVLVT